MGVSEGWRRTFVVLSAVYWVPVLLYLVYGVATFPAEIGDVVSTLIAFAMIYGVLAGLVAGVVWIVAGFRKSKSADE